MAAGGFKVQSAGENKFMPNKENKRALIEVMILVGLMLTAALFFEELKVLMIIAAIVYLLVEGRVRKRTRTEIGFRIKEFPQDIVKNWYLIMLVGVVFQIIYAVVLKNFFPEVLNHVSSRLPSAIGTLDPKIIVSVVILALGEEMIFRGLLQERLSWFVKTSTAIIVSSILFAAVHITNGEFMIVGMDVLTVFLDSLLFGIIYAKTKNIYASTIAHALANTVALSILYYL